MNPLVLYLALVAIAVLIAVIGMLVSRPPTRNCPSCDEDIRISARSCRHCGYAMI